MNAPYIVRRQLRGHERIYVRWNVGGKTREVYIRQDDTPDEAIRAAWAEIADQLEAEASEARRQALRAPKHPKK